MTRQFTHEDAKRDHVPLLIGLAGPSGGGKTLSALRLAKGIERVTGGPTFVVDTESRRASHYAWDEETKTGYKFKHVPFDPPFGPLEYLAAFQHCVRHGAKIIIVDSFSHEHEGSGGVLEQHEEELKRLGGGERHNFRAWGPPKRARQKLLTTMIGMPCSFVLCFRAKEKTKPGKDKGKSVLVDMGFMPIGGSEYLYEMTVRALLPPNADGVPVFSATRPGERLIYKLPQQFRNIFATPHALCENDGEAMARWAAGPKPAKGSAGWACFGKKLQWQGRDKWGGKPLEAADAATLDMYASALNVAKATAKGKALAAITEHVEDVTRIRQLKGI